MMGYERSVAEHERLRPIRMELNSKLLKQVSRKAFDKAGRKLGILIDGVFCFETEDESSVWSLALCPEGAQLDSPGHRPGNGQLDKQP